jgi:hypothetical protein
MAPSVISSLKSLEDHLFCSEGFALTMGNISRVFWLAITKKKTIEDVLLKKYARGG